MTNSTFILDNITKIERSIQSNEFIDVEKSKIELKDLSTGDKWNSLYETICAYLNSDGGVVFGGIRERDKKYTVTGFNRKNESNIIDLQTKFFKNDDGVLLDLSNNIFFDYYSILDKDIIIISVYPLSDDLKYVTYKDKYYDRKLTQEKEIPSSKIQLHKEYKLNLEYSKEISYVEFATISDLSLDKINRYINLLNLEIRNETLKPNLKIAKQFLTKQHFVKEDKVTTLGLLICGEDPFYFLGARSEVNCYYDTLAEISRDKKIFRNDVISMMEDTFRYIWGNIRIGRVIADGGKSEPEYPEKMVREVINNALAHRDYTIDGFVTVTVEPQKWIEIKNPGSFKEKIKILNTDTTVPIRRLVPGIPESKNPKLASVLKVFDKIENQGRGMASLINAALDNQIDLPYYELKENSICLRVPVGKLVDETIEIWLSGFQSYITSKLKKSLTAEHKQVLAYFYKSELLNKQRYFTILLSESNNHFMVIDDLKMSGLIIENQSSTEENPIFILERTISKLNFQDEISDIIGNDFTFFDDATKEILNIIYQYTYFNKSGLKPAEITPEIYRRIHGKNIIPKTFESLGRKVRGICNKLEEEKIFIKGEKNSYKFNLDYTQNKLF